MLPRANQQHSKHLEFIASFVSGNTKEPRQNNLSNLLSRQD